MVMLICSPRCRVSGLYVILAAEAGMTIARIAKKTAAKDHKILLVLICIY